MPCRALILATPTLLAHFGNLTPARWRGTGAVHLLNLGVGAVKSRDILQCLVVLLGPLRCRVTLRRTRGQVEASGLNMKGLLAWLLACHGKERLLQLLELSHTPGVGLLPCLEDPISLVLCELSELHVLHEVALVVCGIASHLHKVLFHEVAAVLPHHLLEPVPLLLLLVLL